MLREEVDIKYMKELFAQYQCQDFEEKAFLIKKTLGEKFMSDETITHFADTIKWVDVWLYQGISKNLYKRFKGEIDREFKANRLPDSWKHEFEKCKLLVNNIKQMFGEITCGCNPDMVDQWSLAPVYSSFYIYVKVPDLINSKLRITVTMYSFGQVNVVVGSNVSYLNKSRGSMGDGYYKTKSLNFDFKMFHWLLYFKEGIREGHRVGDKHFVERIVNDNISKWLQRKLSEEHPDKKMLDALKIKLISL